MYKIFLTFLIIIVMFCCKNYNPKLTGYLLYIFADTESNYSLYDLRNRKLLPIKEKLTFVKHSGEPYRLKFGLDKQYLYANTRDYDIINSKKIYNSKIHCYSLDKKKYILEFAINNFWIEDFQILKNYILVTDKHKILKWNLQTDVKEEIFYTDNDILSFCYFPKLDKIILSVNNNSESIAATIEEINLSNQTHKLIDYSNIVYYSEKYMKLFYYDEKEEQFKTYEVEKEIYRVIKLNNEKYMRFGTFITEDILVVKKKYYTAKYHASLGELRFYNLNTGELSETFALPATVNLGIKMQYVDYDLNEYFLGENN